MAIDQNASPTAPETARSSAIENEIPAYRAISGQAVFSLLCGVLAILSIANGAFLACAVLAVVFGVLADRKIQRYPDTFTGRGLAQAGIGLGMVFGLGTVTVTTVQNFTRSSSAATFAKQYVEVLKSKPVEDALWYKQDPEARKHVSPQEMIAQMKASAKDPFMVKTETATFDAIKERLAASPNEDLHFDKVEAMADDGMSSVATVLLEIHGPGNEKYKEKEQFVLLVLKGKHARGRIDWQVSDVKYPYVPSSYTPAPKPVDDGHGHAH